MAKEVNRGGAMLEADQERVGGAKALGLDETLFLRLGLRRWRMWAASTADIRNRRLIDVFGVIRDLWRRWDALFFGRGSLKQAL